MRSNIGSVVATTVGLTNQPWLSSASPPATMSASPLFFTISIASDWVANDALVDHRAHEVAEILDVADRDLRRSSRSSTSLICGHRLHGT